MLTSESCMKQTRISLSIWFSLRQKWRAVQGTDCSQSDGCIGSISFPAASAVRAVLGCGSSWRCPAQLAPSCKCWFNLNMPWFCQDMNLQQKAQSLPLFRALLISRFSDAPWNYLHSPAVGSWSSSLLHIPLDGPVMPFFQAFLAQRRSSPELEVWGFHRAENKAQLHSLSLSSVNRASRISAQFNYCFVWYPE